MHIACQVGNGATDPVARFVFYGFPVLPVYLRRGAVIVSLSQTGQNPVAIA
ncbi:MAG: hypothetical protein JXA71_10665 [Chitinispirillaceae bacterium]|nr:hypothetical protein [Chitinispirillaceae bacterium]